MHYVPLRRGLVTAERTLLHASTAVRLNGAKCLFSCLRRSRLLSTNAPPAHADDQVQYRQQRMTTSIAELYAD